MTERGRNTADRAIETATDRTKSAEEEFLETPASDDSAVDRAAKVERRADDLATLASDPPEDDPPKTT
jgi:uncharacterized membrane protein YdbT with pleckstrin-like domain